MAESEIIHATLVVINGKGVLLKGKSGCGKSDLALRLIENKGAKLVADDITVLSLENGKITGSAPENIAGLLEVRGVGIIRYSYEKQASIDMVVMLCQNPEEVERIPIMQKDVILGLAINKIDLYAKENSAPDKIVAALRSSGYDSAD